MTNLQIIPETMRCLKNYLFSTLFLLYFFAEAQTTAEIRENNNFSKMTSASACVHLEENGVVAIEAESFDNQTKTDNREWYIQDGTTSTPTPDPDPSHHDTASGGGYLEILPDTRVTHDDPLQNGVNFTNNGGQIAVLDYQVRFTTPGKYFVFARAFSTGTEDNGIHVGIDGTWPSSGNKMQWCSGKNKWTWESKKRDTGGSACGVIETIFIDVPSAGDHTISISMREDGFEVDKFVLSQVFEKPSGAGPDEVLVDCNLSVDDFDDLNASVIISPNPAQDFITIQGVAEGKAAIYDMLGREVISSINILQSENKNIDLSLIPSGMYFIVINDGKNRNMIKFIKQ